MSEPAPQRPPASPLAVRVEDDESTEPQNQQSHETAASTGLEPFPQDGSRRRYLRILTASWLVLAVVAIIAYSAVLTMFSNSAQEVPRPQFDRNVVAVYVQPVQVLPAEGRVVADVSVTLPLDYLEDGVILKDRLSVFVLGSFGSQTLTFPAGAPALALNSQVNLRVDHDTFAEYPWDDYSADYWVLAATETEAGNTWLPVSIGIWGDIPGWHVTPAVVNSQVAQQVPTVAIPYVDAVADVKLNITRAGSTQAIVVLVLGAMIAVACLGVTLAVSVSRRRRRLEVAFGSWFAASLFALVPLRLNLPGSPPIGAWIDFYVFLWVVLAMMVAMTVFLVTWLRTSPRPKKKKKKKAVSA